MNDQSRAYFPALKARMHAAGISGNRLARQLGHSGPGAVSRYLNGKQGARPETLARIEAAFQALGGPPRPDEFCAACGRDTYGGAGGDCAACQHRTGPLPSPSAPSPEIGRQRGTEEPTKRTIKREDLDFDAFVREMVLQETVSTAMRLREAEQEAAGEGGPRVVRSEGPWGSVVETAALEGGEIGWWPCTTCQQPNPEREIRCERCQSFRF